MSLVKTYLYVTFMYRRLNIKLYIFSTSILCTIMNLSSVKNSFIQWCNIILMRYKWCVVLSTEHLKSKVSLFLNNTLFYENKLLFLILKLNCTTKLKYTYKSWHLLNAKYSFINHSFDLQLSKFESLLSSINLIIKDDYVWKLKMKLI